MEKILNIKDFQINDDDQTLFGVLYDNDPTLLGYKIKVNEHPDIDGVVFEYFRTEEQFINSIILGKPLGTFFGTIKILKGWEIIKSDNSISFYLVPNDKTPNVSHFDPNRELKPGEIYVKFRRMNKPHELSSFYIDVRGGSTDGAGRNEHGTPHFHLLKKNTREDLGKIEIPSIDLWNKTQNKINLITIANPSITKSEIKELVDWLQKDNNIQKLHDEWNEANKHNNRIIITSA